MKEHYEHSRLRKFFHVAHNWRHGLWVQHNRKAIHIVRCRICGQYGVLAKTEGKYKVGLIPSLEGEHLINLVACILWIDKEKR